MTRRRVSNPLALAVLGCLTERPMHPYEISQTLRYRGKERSIKLNYGSLYSVVEALHRHGLVVEQQTVKDGRRPERTIYQITEAGVTEFEDWLAELLSTPTREYTSLEAGLSLVAGLPPEEVARLLDGRCMRLEMELRQIRAEHEVAREHGVPDVFLVESLFREEMLVAELRFVRRLTEDITSAALPGTKGWRKLHELKAEGVSIEAILADPVGFLGEEGRPLAMQPGSSS